VLEAPREALKTPPPLKYKETIAIARKYREAIEKALQ